MNRPCRVDGIKQYDLEDEKMLYSADKTVVFSLNDSMSRIWELSDGSRTAREIAQTLAERYGCQADDLIEDIEKGIGEMAYCLSQESAKPIEPCRGFSKAYRITLKQLLRKYMNNRSGTH